jgi:hypothetical protein
MTEVHLDAIMPKEHVQEFLQLMRTFDLTHPDCHFEVTTNDTNMTAEEARAILEKIQPPFSSLKEYKGGNS